MAGPWEQYQSGPSSAPAAKPWEQYGGSATPPASTPKVYYNDAGQPFTLHGEPLPPEPKPDTSYTGTFLPFRRDELGLHLAVPEVIAAPFRGLVSGAARMSGTGEAGRNPLRPLDADTLAAVGMFASPMRFGREAPYTRVDPAAVRAAKQITGILESEAAPPTADIAGEMALARKAGQPMTLADIESPELKSLLGTVYRQGGAAAKRIKDFFEGRNKGASARVEQQINQHLSDQSYRQTAKELGDVLSTNSAPLWREAMAGGSIAPLERQFEHQLEASNRGVVAAQRAVMEADNRVTQAVARENQASNVYASSGAQRTAAELKRDLAAARERLTEAQTERDAVRTRLRQAQADGTANAPGAVWSPELQRFLDQPEVRQGLARGYAIERRRAVGEGKRFNPSEYAVIGEDAAGEPIVGSVPNMKLLAVAKEGLDAIIESDAMHDARTGRLNKTGLSYVKLRNGFRAELDRLNPAYAEARAVWGGDTANLAALREGKRLFDDKYLTVEEIPHHLAEMSKSERQFFILGVADELKKRLYRAVDASDKSRIINNEDVRRRVRPLFQSQELADEFIANIERERTMKRTPTQIYGNSSTAERTEADKRWHHALQALSAIRALGHLDFPGALHAGVRLMGRKPKPNEALNSAIAQMLTDPKVVLELGRGKPLIPLPPPVETARPRTLFDLRNRPSWNAGPRGG